MVKDLRDRLADHGRALCLSKLYYTPYICMAIRRVLDMMVKE
jgi:hypothetical protein